MRDRLSDRMIAVGMGLRNKYRGRVSNAGSAVIASREGETLCKVPFIGMNMEGIR
jgi:hypothetical protein